MMQLEEHASERSTYIIHVGFLDEEDAPVTPNTDTIKWTLTDSCGHIVNSREEVVVTSAEEIDIVLTGLDLAYGEPYVGGERRLFIEWVYDSTIANGLNGTEEVRFTVDNFVRPTGVT